MPRALVSLVESGIFWQCFEQQKNLLGNLSPSKAKASKASALHLCLDHPQLELIAMAVVSMYILVCVRQPPG